MRVVIVTLDGHLAGAVERVAPALAKDAPGLRVLLHAASEWGRDDEALQRCIADIGRADIVVATMLFMEDHIQAVLPALNARRDACDAMVCCMCAGEVMRLTRMGGFKMDGSESGILALLKRLRGAKKKDSGASSGAKQMAMLRRLPQILRFIPGAAQDVRAYFLTLQYWLAGSEENVAGMVRALVTRDAAGPRAHLRGVLKAASPAHYPETGVYHPRMKGRLSERADALPRQKIGKGTVGLLIMRSYVAGNARYYDAAIASFEARGLTVIPAFSTGLDARPAVERFFMKNGVSQVDAVVSLTGFSLVGGPPTMTRAPPRRCWRSSTCPTSRRTPWNSRASRNGAAPPTASCRSRRR